MEPVNLKGGPEADLPSSLEGRDHYLVSDQDPAQLWVGPEGGGSPVRVGGRGAYRGFLGKATWTGGDGSGLLFDAGPGASSPTGVVAYNDFFRVGLVVNPTGIPHGSLTLYPDSSGQYPAVGTGDQYFINIIWGYNAVAGTGTEIHGGGAWSGNAQRMADEQTNLSRIFTPDMWPASGDLSNLHFELRIDQWPDAAPAS